MWQGENLYSISTERQILPVRWQFLPVLTAIFAGINNFKAINKMVQCNIVLGTEEMQAVTTTQKL